MIMLAMEKIKLDPLHSPMYQKSLREYHQTAQPVSARLDQPGHTFLSRRRRARNKLLQQKKAVALEHFEGNSHAMTLSDLKRETTGLVELLEHVQSQQTVYLSHPPTPLPIIDGQKIKRPKLPKRRATLKEFALEQAKGMHQCSNKAVYQYWPDQAKYEFRHALRCNKRNCAVCASFNAKHEAALLQEQLVELLAGLDEDQRRRGRLVHIVLSHENVDLARTMEITKAWRHTQQLKKRVYKRKKNPYDVWNVLKWGLWRWEITRNEDTGYYHPHLHILAWADGWLAPEKGGYWERLVTSWTDTVDHILGLKADWEGQHMGAVLYFSNDSTDPRAVHGSATADIVEALAGEDVREMTKYPVKSTDFTKIMDKNNPHGPDELAQLLYLMHGRRLKNGWGGLKLRDNADEQPVSEVNEEASEYSDELSFEVIFTWDRTSKRYKLYALREWSDDRFDRYLTDLQDYRSRSGLVLSYGLEDSS